MQSKRSLPADGVNGSKSKRQFRCKAIRKPVQFVPVKPYGFRSEGGAEFLEVLPVLEN
jgi:hypothetical protein